MTQAYHVYLTVSGDYTDSALSGEGWQFGIRYRQSFGAADVAGDLPTDIDIERQIVSRDETDWTITGNWKANKVAATFSPDDWLNDQVAPAVATLFGYPDISSKVRVLALKAYPIGSPLGHAIPAPPFATGTPMALVYKGGSQPVGGGSSNIAPLQLSIVTSFLTAQPGRHGRGRIYLPGLPVGKVNANGMISSGDQTEYATVIRDFLADTSITSGLGALVDPIVTGTPYTTYSKINAVRCGRVVDTQRRRRKSLTESYVSVSL